jgi:PilZ domain-containing protein
MSRIFDALKQAQRTRPGQPGPQPIGASATETADRRRSRRWAIDISVYVYGHGAETEPFHEEAHTLNVNATGALLLLSAPVRKGQSLLLTNRFTEQEQGCRVVYVGTKHSRTIEAGIAFPEANPDFWQMPLPPEHKPAA